MWDGGSQDVVVRFHRFRTITSRIRTCSPAELEIQLAASETANCQGIVILTTSEQMFGATSAEHAAETNPL